nr:EcsC family protein [Calothrix sp. PCC 6303]
MENNSVIGKAQSVIEEATHTIGRFVGYFGNNWLVRKLAGVLNLNWLVGAASAVDLLNAAKEVEKLQSNYPGENPRQLAHRIMLNKAKKAGGIGLATSFLPGVAVALLAIDLAATTRLQSEMVYQIAHLYGLDLQNPARKGEVLAIFGLALGGERLLKAAGLGLLRNVPFAGAVIGAGANATMIYSLGYAACRFYETKLDQSKSVASEETLAELKQESQSYLEKAIAQQNIMDKILVHIVLASHPEKTWEEIVLSLQALNFSQSSLDAIPLEMKSPQSLELLLDQLNPDFAVPLLAQCQKIAQINGEITPTEQQVIDTITQRFPQSRG